jgi:hypothetical protein
MGWADSVKTSKKTNNHSRSRSDKVALRRLVLEYMPSARVLDAFAGSGSMYRKVWREADDYVACDQRWYPDDRLAYVCDNRILMRAVDLQPFNVFDLDAYGSPWEQVAILCARRVVAPGEMLGLVLTDGSRLNLKMGGVPLALRQMAGFITKVSGASVLQEEVVDRAIAGTAKALNCELIRRWQATGKTGAGVLYNALILRGLPAAGGQ